MISPSFPLPGSNYVNLPFKTDTFNTGRPLALRFAGLPALFGGSRKLEAVKQCGGDPPAFTCRFLIGVTAMAGV